MPSIFSTTTPIGILLAPARQSRDWASFDRDTTPRPCCRPPPSNKAPPTNRALTSPSRRFTLPNLGSPLGKRSSSSNHGSPLRKRSSPMKAKLRGMPSTRMRLSCLEHTALCMMEKDSVGPGGLPSKAVGPITRTKALQYANRKLEKVAQQQRWLQHLMSVEEACASSGVEKAEPTARTTIPAADWHFTPEGAAAAAATRAVEAAKAAAATAEAEATAQAAAEAASAKQEQVKVVAKAAVTRTHYLDIRAQTRPTQPWHLADPAAAAGAATSKRTIPAPPSAPAPSLTPRAQSAHIRARAHSDRTALESVIVSSSEMCLDGTPSSTALRPMTTPARESPTKNLR